MQLCDQVWPVTAPRFSCRRRSRSISTSRSSFFRHDNSRRSRSSAAAMTLSWTVRPRAVSEIAWVRPSSGAATDHDQTAFLQHRQVAADRRLVETDDVADARGRNAGLDRQQRHDPPFRNVDAEIALIEHGRAVRQLVGDEGDESRNVTVEIEQRAVIGGGELRRLWPARLPREGTGAHFQIIAAKCRPSNRGLETRDRSLGQA